MNTSQEPAPEGVLSKVQKLIDKAFSTTFPAERESLLAKADAMMLRYSIDQFMLEDPTRANMAGPVKAFSPEVREIWYMGQGQRGNSDDLTMRALQSMFYNLASHTHTRIGWYGYYSSKVVGFPADLDFLEMMFLNLKIHLISNVEPTVVSDLSWEQNLVALKQSGMKWEAIHAQLLRHPSYKYSGKPWERNIGVAFTGVYATWRKAHPDEPANVGSPAQWRRSFIEGYVAMIVTRLYEMRRATLANDKNLPALIADKKSAVDVLYEELWPTPEITASSATRSRGRVAAYKAPSLNSAAVSAGRKVARTADLSGRESRLGGQRGVGQ